MPVIDVHAHIYPEKIAEKAVASVGAFYGVEMANCHGTAQSYADVIERTPITHAVVHSVAVKPKTVESINNFIASACEANPNFIGFAAMHQDYENPEAELARAREMGLVGIKIHPDTQGVNLDDDRLMRVYEIAERENMPVILHTGDYRYDFSHPRRLKNVLHEFPNLRVDAAHFGGWSIYDYALEFLEHENCFLDVSSALDYLGPRRSRELIDIYGVDRMLFGSDFPMWNPEKIHAFFRNLGYSEGDFEKMEWRNIENFLGRDVD